MFICLYVYVVYMIFIILLFEPFKISVKMVGDGDVSIFSENGLKKIGVLFMK